MKFTVRLPEIMNLIQESSELYKTKIRSPSDFYVIASDFIKKISNDKECLLCACLDTKNQIKSLDIVSVGILNANIVHPREIFFTAICHHSASIIIAHNHPSGDPTPSKEDIAVTEKLMEAGKLLGIDVLDHVIIGDGRYVSLKDEGLGQ